MLSLTLTFAPYVAMFVMGALCGAAGVKGLIARAKALPTTVAELKTVANDVKKL